MCNFTVEISAAASKPHVLYLEDSVGTEQLFSSRKIKKVLSAAMDALTDEDQIRLLLKDPSRRLVPKHHYNGDQVVSGDGEVLLARDHLALILNILESR